MPIYEPIDAGVTFQVSGSDLVAFEWHVNGIRADLAFSELHLLRVAFDRECIVRILDEMALSTEHDDTPTEGLVVEHFAYRVHGAAFSRMQSEPWKENWEAVAHYRFVTGWACLDVLSSASPAFELRAR